jgi:hypothetical protein
MDKTHLTNVIKSGYTYNEEHIILICVLDASSDST